MAMGVLKQMGMDPNPQILSEHVLPLIFDSEGERHLAQMAEAKIEKSLLFLFDVGLFVTMLVIVAIGIIMIHSATHAPDGGASSSVMWASALATSAMGPKLDPE